MQAPCLMDSKMVTEDRVDSAGVGKDDQRRELLAIGDGDELGWKCIRLVGWSYWR